MGTADRCGIENNDREREDEPEGKTFKEWSKRGDDPDIWMSVNKTAVYIRKTIVVPRCETA